jgi:signal transduction histidine kinase
VARAPHRADFLQTLIDDLLDLAAGKTNLRTPEQPEPVQLNQAVERIAKRFQTPSQERRIRLEWRTECEGQPGPITIWATEAGVDRVLNNALEKEGTGLGLTITRDLIARYDGRITVQSQAGQGTTFTVIWPTMRDA